MIAGRIRAQVEGLELTELDSRRFDLLYSAGEVAIARKLQAIFPRYEDPSEVIEAVFDAFVGMYREQLDIDPIAITARAERPWSKSKIAVPLSRRHHGFSLEQSIGGPHDLSWEIRRDGDQDEIWFTGTIAAVSS